jgi:glycosyltransferase involved in cell wall biosynthesis
MGRLWAHVTPPPGEAGIDVACEESQLLGGLSVALVHEWFGVAGGAEKVFLSIGDLLPHADKYVLWNDDRSGETAEFRESWIGRTPLRRVKPAALPVMPFAWRTLTRRSFDVVISSSHAFAHTVKVGSSRDTRYLSYVHSPARYVWTPELDSRGSHPLLTGARKALQALDLRLSRHVHSYAANSREVQNRIRQYWRRDAVVIHPPVDVDFYLAAPAGQQDQSRDYLLGVGRWIPYKNFDLMIEIAEQARVPLVLAGSGREEASLRRAAAKAMVDVRVVPKPSRAMLRELYWGAKALLYPAHEDFGIVPVEAQACGTPVIGLRRGGLLETVREGETGYLLDTTDPRALASAAGRVEDLNAGQIQANAMRFSADVFAAGMTEWVAREAGNR